MALSILLFTWIFGGFLAQGFFYFVDHMTIPKSAPYQPSTPAPRDKNMPLSLFQISLEQNVFDTELPSVNKVNNPSSDKPKQTNQFANAQRELKKITAQLELRGTLLWTDKNYALIYHRSLNQEKIYGQNTTVFNTKAILFQVEKNRAIFKLDDATDDIKTPVKKIPLNTKNTQIAAKSSPSTSNTNQVASIPVRPVAKSQTKGTTQEYVFQSSEIESELKDFNNLLMKARVEPKIENDEFIGYSISNIVAGSLFERLGLKNADLIKNVNGEVIDSPEKALSIFRVLRNETEFNLQIERQGNPMFLNYSIQ